MQPRLSEAMGIEIVTLFVGKKRKEFKVHKKLICNSSKYFDNAFNRGFKESQESAMYMPEDDPEVIAFFVDWLYRAPLPLVQDTERPKDPAKKQFGSIDVQVEAVEFGPLTEVEHLSKLMEKEREDAAAGKALQARLDKHFDRLFKLYFFAEMKFMNDLKNLAIDRIRQGMDAFDRALTIADCEQIYANTASDSPIRDFCIDLLAYSLADPTDGTIDRIAATQKQVPEIGRGLLVKLSSLMETELNNQILHGNCYQHDPDPRKTYGCDDEFGCGDCGSLHSHPCKYHEHDTTEGEASCSMVCSFC